MQALFEASASASGVLERVFSVSDVESFGSLARSPSTMLRIAQALRAIREKRFV